MSELAVQNLLQNIELESGSYGIFGVCYSVLKWKTVGRGLNLSVGAIKKSAGRMLEDGHAETFFWNRRSGVYTATGMGDEGWVFNDQTDWARTTGSTDTYVYYINVDADFVDRYRALRRQLERSKDVTYHEVWPNLSGQTRYENCVSSSHQIMHKLGLGSVLMAKGWWIPSWANWVSWFTTFRPQKVGQFTWKYYLARDTNTLL